MSTRKISVVTALAGLVGAGLLCGSTPATATSLHLHCDGGPIIACSVDNAASGQSWTVNGASYGPGNGLSDIGYNCWPTGNGHFYNVSVSYLNTSGSPETETDGAWCKQMAD